MFVHVCVCLCVCVCVCECAYVCVCMILQHLINMKLIENVCTPTDCIFMAHHNSNVLPDNQTQSIFDRMVG